MTPLLVTEFTQPDRFGGWKIVGWLRRLVGSREETESRHLDRAAEVPAPIDGGPATWLQVPTINIGASVDVAGEQYYQDALEAVAGGRNAFGTRTRNLTATLVREPDNPYDGNAVRVDVAGAPAGHIGRDDAPRFHAIIDRLMREGSEATCRAVLTGGWDRGNGDRGWIGMKIYTGRRPTKWNGRAAFLPTGPFQEHHAVQARVPAASLPPDRSVVTLADTAAGDVAVEYEGIAFGCITGRPDLAGYIRRVRAAGLPATVQARVTDGSVTIAVADTAAVVAVLDTLGSDELRVMRSRLRPTGRWLCQRCGRLWHDLRPTPPDWYKIEDNFSESPHICPDCGSYAFTHPL